MTYWYGVDATRWGSAKLLVFDELLPSLRCERQLLTGDLEGLAPEDIRKLALVAWGDPKRATAFAMEVYRSRLFRAGRE